MNASTRFARLVRSATLLVALSFVTLVARDSAADWRQAPITVAVSDNAQVCAGVAPGPDGGVYLFWTEPRGTTRFGVALREDGSIPETWNPTGLSLPNISTDWSFASDGSGGVFSTAEDVPQVLQYHVAPNATVSTPWMSPVYREPVPATPDKLPSAHVPEILADGAGGAFLVWTRNSLQGDHVCIHHFGPDGSPVSGWPFVITNTYWMWIWNAVVCSDGAGGVWLAWSEWHQDPRSWDIDAHHILADGSPDYAWAEADRMLCGLDGVQESPGIAPDGTGGFYLVWQDARNGSFARPFAQHNGPDRLPLPGWGATGIPLSATATDPAELRHYSYLGGSIGYSTVVADGHGGAYVVWLDRRDGGASVYAHHLVAGGLDPQWPATGLAVGAGAGDQREPRAVSDGDGGLYVVWTDLRNDPAGDVYIQRLAPNGIVHDWPVDGTALTTAGAQSGPVLTRCSDGAIVIAWTDESSGHSAVMARRFEHNEVVATEASLVAAEATTDGVHIVWSIDRHVGTVAIERSTDGTTWSIVAVTTPDASDRVVFDDAAIPAGERRGYRLRIGGETFGVAWLDAVARDRFALAGLRPNPASKRLLVSFALAGTAPARIELYDAMGRRVIARDVAAAAGSHSLDLGSARDLDPGVYFVRLVEGARSIVTRGVVAR